MRLRLAWMLLLAAGCSESSKDGGTIPWRGKDGSDLKPVLAEAKERGKAMMLFFSSEG